MTKNCVKVGDYIVIQRQNYTKLHKVSCRENVMLGKDQIDIGAIIGKPVWTTYKMVQKKNSKRAFILQECDSSESLAEQLIKDVSSGVDNRNIFDDGRSQLLSTEEIVGLRTSGLAGKEIVEQLIENSKTFRDKTEYSQEKYLKKKERKYFEYVTIRWPTIRLISEIMFRVDSAKIMGLRMDTLSQILTAVGMHSQGTYIVYESGCQALMVASMLNNIAEGGNLIHIHPGNIAQKTAVYAMNFSDEQQSRLMQVNVYSVLRKLLQEDPELNKSINIKNCDDMEREGEKVEGQNGIIDAESSVEIIIKDTTEEHSGKEETINMKEKDVPQLKSTCQNNSEDNSTEDKDRNSIEGENMEEKKDSQLSETSKKRKHSEEEESESKKPRWELDTEKAANLLRQKTDGLVLVAREHPSNILLTLLPYVAPSRPFVVFCPCREPLLELYVKLKSRNITVGLRVTETLLRRHQILPNRTHPDILMSGGGGYLLMGIVVDSGPPKSC